MQTFKWPISRSRKEYERILSDDNYRGLFTEVLEEIEERSQDKEWAFEPQDMAEITGADKTDVDNILKYIYNLKYFRVQEPTINREDGGFKTNPRFSKEDFKKTKIKYEILAKQKQLGNYFKKEFPDRKVVLNLRQSKKIEETLKSLRKLRQDSTIGASWQECLASYELLKREKGRNPKEREVANFMGLKEHRLKGRNWLRKINENGYSISLMQHVRGQAIRKDAKKNKVNEAYKKLKEEKKEITAAELADEASIGEEMTRKYASELKLKLVRADKKRRDKRLEKIKDAHKRLKKDYPPTRKELAKETGIPEDYVRKACKSLGLDLLSELEVNKRTLLQIYRKLQSKGVKTEELNIDKLKEYADKEHPMSHNTLEKWRRELETEKKIPISKTRLFLVNYPRYEATYLNIVKRKLGSGEKIRFVDIAKEMSEVLDEKVPSHWATQLRDATGMPKRVDNETRYENMVRVYRENPGIFIEDWAKKAKVSMGFIYSTLRKLRKNPNMLERFKAPRGMVNKVAVEEDSKIMDFKALGNTNRLKILKALGSDGEMTVSKIADKMGYNMSKWGHTIKYHCGVLENAGMLVEDNERFKITKKTENMMPFIFKWDVEKLVPEEIFGTSYNKALFASALAGKRKNLKEIIKTMREEKVAVPLEVPSSISAERHPIHKNSSTENDSFKKYFDHKMGRYKIKKKYAGVLVPIINEIEKWSKKEKPKPKERMPVHPRYLVSETTDKDLDYFRIRRIVEQLVRGNSVYQTQLADDEDESMRYMMFIKKNFASLCRRMKIKPSSGLSFSFDREMETYVMRMK
jgi:DNA-binding transcriptional ArsR family regulator